MAHSFVDRRRPRGAAPLPPCDPEARAREVWASLWPADRPLLSDAEAGLALVALAVGPIVARAGPVYSRARRSWPTAQGVGSRSTVAPSRSRRDGAQSDPERNVRAYLLGAVLGLSNRELGLALGLTRSAARSAALAGGRIVARARAAGMTMTRPD